MEHKTKSLLRITTVPITMKVLFKGQLKFMKPHFDEIYAISSNGESLASIRELGIYTYPIEIKRKPSLLNDFKSLFQLYKKIKELNPSIVHTHTPKAGFLGMLAAKMAGIDHRFHTVAGIPWIQYTGLKRRVLSFFEKWTYKMASEVYFNSFNLKKFAEKNNLISSGGSKVLGNGSTTGVDTNYFKQSEELNKKALGLREQWSWNTENFTYVFVGRIVNDKGINELIQAFCKLNDQNKKTRLLLVGPYENSRDPLHEQTISIINDHPNIVTTGFVDDVRPYMLASDVLVFPSYREGFPNVPMQAGALGLPLIVTDINGCNEIVEHKKNGLIIPIKNEHQLFISMKDVYENKLLFNDLSRESRDSIVNRFQQEIIWQEILKEYMHVLRN